MEWQDILKVMKENNLQLSLLYPARISFRYEGEFKSSAAAAAKLLQSYPTLHDPIDSSPPGSPIPGILQARTLEWVAISFSQKLYRQAKPERIQHHQTSSSTNAKGSSLDRKHRKGV